MSQSQRLKRTHLYDLVWVKAMVHVARDLGLSDVGLAKLCRRHEIPVPGRGYWARLQHGQKPKQTPLPPLSGGDDPWIVIQGSTPPATGSSGNAPDNRSAEAQVELSTERRLTVADAVTEVHPSLRKTAAELRRRKADETGRVALVHEGCFLVQVAPANVERSIRILHALCTAFDDRGYPVVKKQGEGVQPLQVAVKDESLGFSLEERTRQVLHHPMAVATRS